MLCFYMYSHIMCVVKIDLKITLIFSHNPTAQLQNSLLFYYRLVDSEFVIVEYTICNYIFLQMLLLKATQI